MHCEGVLTRRIHASLRDYRAFPDRSCHQCHRRSATRSRPRNPLQRVPYTGTLPGLNRRAKHDLLVSHAVNDQLIPDSVVVMRIRLVRRKLVVRRIHRNRQANLLHVRNATDCMCLGTRLRQRRQQHRTKIAMIAITNNSINVKRLFFSLQFTRILQLLP